MKLNLKKKEIEAIQKLLNAHSGYGGQNPNCDTCYEAYLNILNQTNIQAVTEEDIIEAKKRLKNKKYKLYEAKE